MILIIEQRSFALILFDLIITDKIIFEKKFLNY
jgi:hypothetical protein